MCLDVMILIIYVCFIVEMFKYVCLIEENTVGLGILNVSIRPWL